MRAEFDFVIVGAGAAGCVVAARLSADPSLRVALVESGKDYGYGTEPAAIRDTYARAWSHPEFLWPGLKISLREDEPEIGYLQGHLVGGGSAVMGMHALRGLPGDYDEWSALGASGWGWEGVKPYFLRLERDLDYPGPEHGDGGPVTIWRQKPERMPAFSRAVAAALSSRGFGAGLDVNVQQEDGVYPMPFNATAERRVTTAYAYLTDEVRKRPNLSIFAETRAQRIVFEGRRAVAVTCARKAGDMVLGGREIVLCCGALQTPVLLMRSGVGPRQLSRETGVEMVAELPGVGANLLNHPILPVAGRLRRGHRHPASVRPHVNSLLRYSSGVEGCPEADMYVAIMGTTAWHRTGRTIGALAVSAYKTFSRGHIEIRGRQGLEEPRICLNLLTDERDLERMARGLALALDTLADPAVSTIVSGPFLPGGSPWIRRLSTFGLRNMIVSSLASTAMDVVPGVERLFLGMTGLRLSARPSRAELRSLALRYTASMYHPVGTCRLGAADDPGAVVLPDCAVRGLGGLSVADASIMPTIPRANTFLTSVMIGEKAADLVRSRIGREIALSH